LTDLKVEVKCSAPPRSFPRRAQFSSQQVDQDQMFRLDIFNSIKEHHDLKKLFLFDESEKEQSVEIPLSSCSSLKSIFHPPEKTTEGKGLVI